MSLEMKLKRGGGSWAYFPLAFNILLTIFISIISLIPGFYCSWIVKIALIILISALLYKLCFFNSWFRNKIIGIFSKSKEMEETFKKT
jgi:hypothetical protein